MAKKIKTSRNRWNVVKTTVEQNSGEIITVPNQTQSVRDILFRNTQGMTYDNYKTPYYEEQATFSTQALNKIQEMEPVEKLQYLKEINAQVKDLSNKIKTHEAEKAAAAEAAAKAAVVQEEQKTPEN